MSNQSPNHLTQPVGVVQAVAGAPDQRDWAELTVHATSRFAGYFSLVTAAFGLAYMTIR
jgi:hypothetical protein